MKDSKTDCLIGDQNTCVSNSDWLSFDANCNDQLLARQTRQNSGGGLQRPSQDLTMGGGGGVAET